MSAATRVCPIDTDHRKSAGLGSRPSADERRVAGFGEGRNVLRDPHARQAGFKAELVQRFASVARPPILYLHGDAHRRQRGSTARFFAPKVVAARYRPIMDATADRLAEQLRRNGRADLDALALDMAVTVAADIVGLTQSSTEGLIARLERLFAASMPRSPGWRGEAAAFLRGQWRMIDFHRRDVRCAIRARRLVPRDDVVSHLIAEGYSEREILTECVTYGAAGMVTTREFISMAGWHLLERPDLADAFVAADEARQLTMLEEILRLEPVIGALRRRIGTDRIAVDIRAANIDERAVGRCPLAFDPDRKRDAKVGGAGLAFGDGEHRCPGAGVALHEAAVLLDRLLRIPGIRLAAPPRMGWNPLALGYELRGCRLEVADHA